MSPSFILVTYDTEEAIGVAGWTRCEKELVGISICMFVGAKGQRPEAVDFDGPPAAISQYAKERTRLRVISIDPATLVDPATLKIANQECMAELSEIGGSHGKTPWCLERSFRKVSCETAKEIAIHIKDIDKSSLGVSKPREGNVEFILDVLNAKRPHFVWDVPVGK